FVAERLPAFDRQPVVRPLAPEWQRAAVDRLAEAHVTGIPSSAWLALAHVDHGAEPLELFDYDRVRVRRYEHGEWTPGGARHDGGCERGVAARRDGERVRGPRARHSTEALEHLEVDRDSHQVPRLVRARHVRGLVFDEERCIAETNCARE